MHAAMSVGPSSTNVSTKLSGVPRTSRKWTKWIRPASPKWRIAAGRSSVIIVMLEHAAYLAGRWKSAGRRVEASSSRSGSFLLAQQESNDTPYDRCKGAGAGEQGDFLA